jgi:serine O-acetyltransferase
VSTTFSSYLELISTDYKAKYSEIRVLRFIVNYILDTAIFAIVNYRLACYLQSVGLARVARFITILTERIAYIHISQDARIGPGLCVPHGFGIIIGGNTVLGSHCTIQQGVTIGGNFWKEKEDSDGSVQEYPIIGDYVHLGSGCVVAGPINVGNSVIIGANTTVTSDIQDYSIVMGSRSEVVTKIDPNNEEHRKRFFSAIPEPEDGREQ